SPIERSHISRPTSSGVSCICWGDDDALAAVFWGIFECPQVRGYIKVKGQIILCHSLPNFTNFSAGEVRPFISDTTPRGGITTLKIQVNDGFGSHKAIEYNYTILINRDRQSWEFVRIQRWDFLHLLRGVSYWLGQFHANYTA